MDHASLIFPAGMKNDAPSARGRETLADRVLKIKELRQIPLETPVMTKPFFGEPKAADAFG